MSTSKDFEIYIDQLKTDIGYWVIKADNSYVLAIRFDENDPKSEIRSNNITRKAKDQLKEYFDGKRKKFDLPLFFESHTPFQQMVWNKLLEIPYGNTISYTDLSVRLGNLKAIRAVANANGKNPFTIVIPCHRVIGKDGSMTGYAHGKKLKRQLLIHEGALEDNQLSLFV